MDVWQKPGRHTGITSADMDENSKHCQRTGDLPIFEVTAFKDSLVELLSCGGTGEARSFAGRAGGS